MFLDPILCSQQKQRCFSKLKICSIRLPEDKQIKMKYTVFIWFLRRGGGGEGENQQQTQATYTLFYI